MRITDKLDWNLIRTFVTVANAGSLAGASRELQLAHPTVARHVQQLETALGQTLFDRRSSGLRLNASGRVLADAAQVMLAGAREFAETSLATSHDAGPVRITASELLADVFPALLKPLRDVAAGSAINVDLIIAQDQLNLLDGAADMAIRHIRPHQQDVLCRRLEPLPFGLFASLDYLREHGEPNVGSLDRHWYIDAVTAPRFAPAARRLGFTIPASQFVFRSDSLTGQLHGALAGWGIVGLPQHIARLHRTLQPVLAEAGVTEIELWLVGRPGVRTTGYLNHAFSLIAARLNDFSRSCRSFA